MKIAVIVLNWKQPKLTIDTVESFLKIKHSNFSYKILLVDNGSPDDSILKFSQLYGNNKNVEIIKLKKNLGYVGGNNAGIKYSLKNKFDYSLLTNNDVIVDPDFLNKLIVHAKKDKITSIFGPKIYFAPGFEFHKDRYSKKDLGKVIWSAGGKMDWANILGSNIAVDEVDKGQYDTVNRNVDFISGCCILVDNKVFKKIGFLNEKYFMYLEDVEFCQKAKKQGYGLAYIPDSKIWHINAGSSKSGGDLHDYFITRNRLLFAKTYASFRARFALFREAVRILFTSNSKWKRIAVIDFFINKTGKGSWK
jgi:GT2 family glycosyltransferase